MTSRQPCQLDQIADDRGVIWDQSGFQEIQSIIGERKAEALLRSYGSFLTEASATLRNLELSARQLRETTHDLKSMSGNLGFQALEAFCEMLLADEDVVSRDTVVEPLLSLISVSNEAAELYCRTSNMAAPKF